MRPNSGPDSNIFLTGCTILSDEECVGICFRWFEREVSDVFDCASPANLCTGRYTVTDSPGKVSPMQSYGCAGAAFANTLFAMTLSSHKMEAYWLLAASLVAHLRNAFEIV